MGDLLQLERGGYSRPEQITAQLAQISAVHGQGIVDLQQQLLRTRQMLEALCEVVRRRMFPVMAPGMFFELVLEVSDEMRATVIAGDALGTWSALVP